MKSVPMIAMPSDRDNLINLPSTNTGPIDHESASTNVNLVFRTMSRFSKNEDGIATVWSLFWLVLCLAISGIAVDTTNAWKTQQILQSTADVAAHAGALELGTVGNDSIIEVVREASNHYASLNVNSGRYGDILVDDDIQVGYWDNDAKTFTEMDAGSIQTPNAVRATTRRDGVASASVGTFFLRFVGFNEFTISTSAVVQRFVPQCEGDGIFANGENNSSAQQTFIDRFCMHGEKGITFAQRNTFEEGTIASTPNLDNCGPSFKSCTDAHNPGIEDALRAASNPNGKVAKIETYIAELQNRHSDYQPKYIDQNLPIIYLTANDFDASTIQARRIYVVSCNSGQNLNLSAPSGGNENGNGKGKEKGNSNGNGGGNSGHDEDDGPLVKSEFVLVGLGCDFVFDSSISYEDATFATTATGNQTFSGSAGVILGKNDGCTQGGEVVAITTGSVHFSAKLEAYDVEFIIRDDLHLASNGNAESVHSGSNFYVGGDVRITSQHTFAGCNGKTIPPFDTKYSWRLVA